MVVVRVDVDEAEVCTLHEKPCVGLHIAVAFN